MELVVAVLAVDVVVAAGAEQHVGPALAEERVVARRAVQDVAQLGARDDRGGVGVVGALGRHGDDRLAVEQRVAGRRVGLDVDRVVAVAAVDVVAAVVGGADGVVAVAGVDRVGIGPADDEVVAVVAEELVGA